MASIDSLKPGQKITITVNSLPRSEGGRKTLARLMREDPEAKRGLAAAQKKRRQRMNVYNRGNRDWVSREKPAIVVRVEKGRSWTMVYTPDLASEFKNLEKHLKIA